MATAHHYSRINLKLRDLAQLFNSMDPSPFLDRDLDQDAEEFIVSWAHELPKGHRFELVIHLATPPEPDRAADVENAVQHYFANRANFKRREFRRLLRRGHVSLLIGLLFLAACLLASGLAARIEHETAAAIVREGFIIAGWVAMWRPIQIYLYDWWPVRDELRVLHRLARIRVRLILPPAPDAGARPPQGAPAAPAN